MVRLTKYDLHTIQSLSEKKRWRGIEICRQIKNKHWVIRSVNNAIKRLDEKIWLIQNGLLVHKQHKKSGYKSVKMLITPQTAGGAIQRR